jgi:hypothetical protein
MLNQIKFKKILALILDSKDALPAHIFHHTAGKKRNEENKG